MLDVKIDSRNFGANKSDLKFDANKINPGNFNGFKKARKRPFVIDAVQLNVAEGFTVKTNEGFMLGKPGDYLIIGVEGEKYPIDKEIFEKTYEIVGLQGE